MVSGSKSNVPDTSLSTCSSALPETPGFLYPHGFQIPCEGPVPQAVVADDLGSDDLPVLDFIDLELLRMAEVLEDLPVFISCSYLHSIL